MFKLSSHPQGVIGIVVTLLIASFILVNAEVYRSCTKTGTAAITFDDGPHPEYTKIVLDVLKASNITSTFFLNGVNGNETRYRETVRRMYSEGHQIGSHTWNHLDLTGLSAEEIRRELKQVADLIYDILQVNMTVFRPPYGSYNDLVLQIAQEFNYDVIIWNVDTEDWLHRENTTISIQAWINAVNANGAEGTYIGLHHDPYSGNTNLTQMTIDVLKSQLLKITTVADCIGKPMFYE